MGSVEKSITDLVRKLIVDVHTIYLFGSRATSTHFSDKSDWDIALLSTSYTGFSQRVLWDAQLEIAACLDIQIDLVDFSKGSTVLQYEILKSSKVLWSKSQAYAHMIEAQYLGAYQDFMESQKALHSDILERGKVYGG